MLVFQFRVHNHFSPLCPYQICFSRVCAFVTTDLLIDFQPLSNICEVWFYLWFCTKLGWGEEAPLRLADGVFLETLAGKCLTAGVTICGSGNFSAVTSQRVLQSPPCPALPGGAGPWCSLLSAIQIRQRCSALRVPSTARTLGGPEDAGVNSGQFSVSPSFISDQHAITFMNLQLSYLYVPSVMSYSF